MKVGSYLSNEALRVNPRASSHVLEQGPFDHVCGQQVKAGGTPSLDTVGWPVQHPAAGRVEARGLRRDPTDEGHLEASLSRDLLPSRWRLCPNRSE